MAAATGRGETSDLAKCPDCGNLLGVVEDAVLHSKHQGRTFHTRIDSETYIECCVRRPSGRRCGGVWRPQLPETISHDLQVMPWLSDVLNFPPSISANV